MGTSENLDRTLHILYQRHVEQYARIGDVPRRSDEEVWRVFGNQWTSYMSQHG